MYPNPQHCSQLLQNLRIPASTIQAIPEDGLVALGRLVTFGVIATSDMSVSVIPGHKTARDVTPTEIRER